MRAAATWSCSRVVSFGAEVIADGNIHVYAPLRGKAIAGARGNTEARIFTHLHGGRSWSSIAGIYRTDRSRAAGRRRAASRRRSRWTARRS